MTKALLVAVVVVALTGAACGGGESSDCTSENATDLAGPLTIMGIATQGFGLIGFHEGTGATFSPNCFSAASGSTISVANEDGVAHTFTVPDTDVDVPLPAGGTGEATAPAPGTYDFLCTIHPSMTGTIIVT